MPATFAGSSAPSLHSAASAAAAPGLPDSAASASGAAGSAAVTDAPRIVKSGWPGTLTVTVEANWRSSVDAATDVVHGTTLGVPTVPAPGPALPAEFAMKTPALTALSIDSSSAPNASGVSLPSEMLITSTPSATAWSIALMMSDVAQPVTRASPLLFQHTL